MDHIKLWKILKDIGPFLFPDVSSALPRRGVTTVRTPTRSTTSYDLYFCFIDYVKAFDCVDHNKLWKILKEMGIPDYLTCLLRNLYAGQEATVRTGHGTTDWFQIGKGVRQGCMAGGFFPRATREAPTNIYYLC